MSAVGRCSYLVASSIYSSRHGNAYSRNTVMLEFSLAVQHISHEGGRSSLKVLSIDYIEVGQCLVSIVQNKEMFTLLRAVKHYTQHNFTYLTWFPLYPENLCQTI